jgi:hypothetical protein
LDTTVSEIPPPDPYGQPYPQQRPYYQPPDHRQATTVLVLGILGLVLCQILSPVAWVMGNRVVQEIDASGGQLGGRGAANAGRICGIVGTVLIGVGLLFLLLIAVVGIAGMASS